MVHTDLHECLGHGSGQLLPTTLPNSLKEYSSTLEEARADLFGLYYCADPKLVELGIMPDSECYKAEYYGFIRNGLLSQLARIELGKNVTESHMQDRKLISEWCYEHGKKDNVIEKKSKTERHISSLTILKSYVVYLASFLPRFNVSSRKAIMRQVKILWRLMLLKSIRCFIRK